ncbi:CDP-alcohol phosphatidyltransferase family protein [Chitinispirillales bacterium ANBcel5]|uniref:CDP-alcohol phosphatidyltransferase family protein n=1 Tax=Cellulosispirillum alkaliphilum TaxID=3039283 RepID=UPI002A50FB14|nr:CDP-alcohol phosphatidyltransferase family protein [Chitinispirillales bacterium ANBcel5]
MNIATLFTTSRVVFAPLFAYFFITGFPTDQTAWIWICFALAVLIELSDLLDGTIARSRGEVTDFGKVFDPVADSVSRQTIFISFMVTGVIPLWMYLIFFYRDAFLQLLRIVCASSGIVLAARKSGKAKAVLQGIATFGVLFVILLLRYQVEWMPAQILGFHPGFWVMLLPTLFTLLSVIDYVIPNRKLIGKMMETK